MNTPFAARLLELLPPVYRERDVDGDLAAFLAVPGPTLDEIKGLIDRLPSCWDVDACDDEDLPFLAATLGIALDLRQSSASHRRTIREAVEQFRRKATIPAMHHALERLGWQGQINETYHQALRLNRRAVVSQAKLPGERFSLGVYQVASNWITDGLRAALAPHHPAGTRQFFLQHIREHLGAEPSLALFPPLDIRTAILARDYETFTVGRNGLNTDWHLTVKAKVRELWGVHTGHSVRHDVSQAELLWMRWHAPRCGFRVSRHALNQGRMQNVQTWEAKTGFRGGVDTQHPDSLSHTALRLGAHRLGTCFGSFEPASHVVFRQNDFLGESALPVQTPLADGMTLLYADRARLAQTFRVRHSRLGGRQKLTHTRAPQCVLMTWLGVATRARAREAQDIVDRWEARRNGFVLGGMARLNAAPLTTLRMSQARASFELDVDTAWPYGARAESVHLNRRRLNHAALRMSPDRTTPLVLGRTRLNAAGLRVSKASLRWRYRQRDDQSIHGGGPTEAVNTLRATSWPATPENFLWGDGAPLAAYNRYLATRWPEA